MVHTLQSLVLLADVQTGQLAKKMERRKVMERQALCKRSGWSFSPFAMETIGVWGGKANSLLQKLVTVWANSNGCTQSGPARPGLCGPGRAGPRLFGPTQKARIRAVRTGPHFLVVITWECEEGFPFFL